MLLPSDVASQSVCSGNFPDFIDFLFAETILQHDPKVVDLPANLDVATSDAAVSEEVAATTSAEVIASQPFIEATITIPEAGDAGTKRTSDNVDDVPVSKTSKLDE